MALNSLRKTKLQQGWQWEGKKTALPLHLSLVTCYFVVLHWYKGLEQGLCAALVKYLKSRRGAFIFEFLHLVFACIFVIPLREAAYWERKPHNHLLLKPLWQRLIVLLIHHVQLQLKSLSRQPQHALIQIDCVLFCFLNLYAIRFSIRVTKTLETLLFGWVQQNSEAHVPESSHSWILHLWENDDWQPM